MGAHNRHFSPTEKILNHLRIILTIIAVFNNLFLYFQSSSLIYLFDRELNVTKSLTKILKKYLSRNVVIKYTAKKKVPGKRIMQETYFYECISGNNF